MRRLACLPWVGLPNVLAGRGWCPGAAGRRHARPWPMPSTAGSPTRPDLTRRFHRHYLGTRDTAAKAAAGDPALPAGAGPVSPRSPLRGVDEYGRGPCAGRWWPAVILDPAGPSPACRLRGEAQREARNALAIEIREKALAWCIAETSVGRDRPSQHPARLHAGHAARGGWPRAAAPACRWMANRCPRLDLPCEAVVKGDSLVAEISAASILAKTARDARARRVRPALPLYGLAGHKGYPTATCPGRAQGPRRLREIYRTSFGRCATSSPTRPVDRRGSPDDPASPRFSCIWRRHRVGRRHRAATSACARPRSCRRQRLAHGAACSTRDHRVAGLAAVGSGFVMLLAVGFAQARWPGTPWQASAW